MKLWTALCRLLSILTVVGLMTASMAPPSMAAVGTASPSVMDMASMPDDMPCCPGGDQAPDCDKACPLAILCLGMGVAQASAPGSMIARLDPIAVMLPGGDSAYRSRAAPPPRKPPRL